MSAGEASEEVEQSLERQERRSRSPIQRRTSRRSSRLILVSAAEAARLDRVEALLEQIGQQVEAIRSTPSRIKIETLLESITDLGEESGVERSRARTFLERGVGV